MPATCEGGGLRCGRPTDYHTPAGNYCTECWLRQVKRARKVMDAERELRGRTTYMETEPTDD